MGLAGYKIAVVLLIVGLVVGAGAGFGIGIQPSTHPASTHPEFVALQSRVTPPALPAEAVQLSPLVPGMGEHWSRPQDLPFGPLYLVFEGKVIGLEFMFTQEMMEEITIPGEGTFFESPALKPINAYIDHASVEYLPQGHPGFEVPHYDVHIYFVTEEKREAIGMPPS